MRSGTDVQGTDGGVAPKFSCLGDYGHSCQSLFMCVCVCTYFACLIFVLAALSHAFVLRISSVMTHEKHTFFCRVVFNFFFLFFVFQTRRCHSLVSYFTQNLAGNDRLVTPVHSCPPVSLCSTVSLSSFCALLGVFLCLGSIYWPCAPNDMHLICLS